MNYEEILKALRADDRYRRNLEWGRPRQGHPEGTLRAHIEELEDNLDRIAPLLAAEETHKLRILIHVHDTFKPDAKGGVPIVHPESHASLAKEFLSEYCDDEELLTIVQYHDEPYALWRQWKHKGSCNTARLDQLLEAISDWDLFLAFLIVDGCTAGKTHEPLCWWFDVIAGRVNSRIAANEIIR